MKIKSISATNFMSFNQLDYDFPDAGVYFIAGEVVGSDASNSNGAGKSSAIAETLSFALYGRTIRKVGKDDIVSWRAKKNCGVSVTIEDDLGDEYLITRFRNDHSLANGLYLFKGDVDLTQSDSRITQEAINKIIGMSWLTFSTIVIFGQLAARFAEAQVSEKNEILDELFQFQQYQEALLAVKQELKELEKSGVELESSHSSVKAVIDTLAREQADVERKIGELKVKEEVAEEAVVGFEADIVKLKDELESLDWEKGLLEGERMVLEDDVEKLDEYLSRVRMDQQAALKVGSSELSLVLSDVRVFESAISGLTAKLSMIESADLALDLRCDACGQVITEDSVVEATEHFKAELSTMRKQLEMAVAKRDKVVEQQKVIEDKWNKKFDSAVASKGQAEELLRNHSLKVREKTSDIEKKEEAIRFLNSEIKEARSGIALVKRMLEEDKKRIAETVKEKTVEAGEVESLLKDIVTEKSYLNFWVVGFGNQGIKSLLLDEIVPELNNKVGYYVSVLTDSLIQVTFSTQTELKSREVRDKFDVRIIKDGVTADYKSLSGGERRRVDVATLLALQSLLFNRVAGSCNFMVLDEVADTLDDSGIEKVVSLLKEEAERRAIFVISHDSNLKNFFNQVITIRKEDGVSRLEA